MQRILIVDDNEDIREVLGTYVAKEGFEPVVAKDGFEALDLFKKANPAVVLLDDYPCYSKRRRLRPCDGTGYRSR